MENKITLSDLIDLLAKQADIPTSEAEVFLKTLFDTITETLSEDEAVKIKDFGTFKLTPIQARESIDVNSGEKIEIPAHNRLSFSPATALKELVNKPFSHFETVLLDEGITFEGVEEVFEVEENEEVEIQPIQIHESSEKIEIEEQPIYSEEPDAVIVEEVKAVSTEIPAVETYPYQEVFRPDKTLLSKPTQRTKIPSVWIPVLGGVAIALASFFFLSMENRKKANNIN